MNIISWEDFKNRNTHRDTPVAATIGVFDGIHIGHQALIKEITTVGGGLHPTVITFKENPARVLRSNTYRGDIYTLRQKLEAFSHFGVETTVLIDFSLNFSKLSGRDFIFTVYNSVNLTLLVLGKNFRCGEYADTTAEMAREYLQNSRCEVRILKQVTADGAPVSSTRVRELILRGNLGKTEQLLGSEYKLDITNVEKENRDADTIIMRDRIGQLLPPPGDYPVRLENGVSEKETEFHIYDNKVVFKEPKNFASKQLRFT